MKIESKISGERVMWVVILENGTRYNCESKEMAEKVKKAIDNATK